MNPAGLAVPERRMPGQGCMAPPRWCTHHGAVYSLRDCDADGRLDPYCSSFYVDGRTGFISSIDSCRDTFAEGETVQCEVSCGGHEAETCHQCPQGHGAAWCHGECSWVQGECVPTNRVSLGSSSVLATAKDQAHCLTGLNDFKASLRRKGFALPGNGEDIDFVEGGLTEAQFLHLGALAQAEFQRLSRPLEFTACQTGFNYGNSAFAFLCFAPAAAVLSWDLGVHGYVRVAEELLQSQFPGRHHLTIGDSRQTLRNAVTTESQPGCNIVFVDGGHYEDTITADIYHFMQLAHQGALLIVDDCSHDGGLMAGGVFSSFVGNQEIREEQEAARHFGPERSFCVGRYG